MFSHYHFYSILVPFNRWVKWREECFARARRKTYVPPGANGAAPKPLGTKILHQYFFTEEASDDFLRMLVVIPQYIRSYTKPRREDDNYRFVIPRRITQDFLENRYGDIKLKVRHNGLTANNVLSAVHTIEIAQVHQQSARGSTRKRNAGEGGADQGEGEQRPVRSVRARFNPLEELTQLTLRIQEERNAMLDNSGYTAAMKMCILDFN